MDGIPGQEEYGWHQLDMHLAFQPCAVLDTRNFSKVNKFIQKGVERDNHKKHAPNIKIGPAIGKAENACWYKRPAG